MARQWDKVRDLDAWSRLPDASRVEDALGGLAGTARVLGKETMEAFEDLEIDRRAHDAVQRLELEKRARKAGRAVEHRADELAHPAILGRIRLVRRLARLAALGFASVIVYRKWLRRRVFTWGATEAEAGRRLPGDDLVGSPRVAYTRAVTVEAEPSDIWPWLAQMGQGRGGLYSYDWLENLAGCEMESADRILPEHQGLEVGDAVRLVPEDYSVDLHFEVAAVEPDRALVLKTPGDRDKAFQEGLPHASWAFILEPEGGGSTRLIARWRADFDDRWPSRAVNGWAIELPHFFMERKMLHGIKERAERRTED